MEVSKTNTLSFYNDQGVLTLSAKQYDTGRKFIFNIVNDYEPCDLTGYSVYLRILKADGRQFQGEECCIIEGNKVIVDTSVGNGDQILTSDGINTCELHLTDNEGKSITTWNFIINVAPRVHNGDHIDSIDSWDLWDSVGDNIFRIESTLTTHINNKENPHEVTVKQLNLENVENKSSETIRSEITKDNVTNALGYTPYTPDEVDNKFSTLESNIDWKESVETYADILTVYPNPEKGWTVNADNTTYRYNGTEWVDIGITAIPKATSENDGLFSKEGYEKLDGIESGAQANTITGIKGNAETDYRTGNVNLTPSNIGALADNGNLGNNTISMKKYISEYQSPFLIFTTENGYNTNTLIKNIIDGHESAINGIYNDLCSLQFDDTTSTYSTLPEANTAAETSASNIKNKVSLIDFIKNAKQSFSAIIQGLKILGTNVGAIQGITDSLTATSSNVALSAKGGNNLQGQINTLNSNLNNVIKKALISSAGNYDANNYTDEGRYSVSAVEIWENLPNLGESTAHYGVLLVFNASYYIAQCFIHISKVYFRIIIPKENKYTPWITFSPDN